MWLTEWITGYWPGAALVFNGPANKYRGNPKARSLSVHVYILTNSRAS